MQLPGKRKFLGEKMAKSKEEIMVSAQRLAWVFIARRVVFLQNEITNKIQILKIFQALVSDRLPRFSLLPRAKSHSPDELITKEKTICHMI